MISPDEFERTQAAFPALRGAGSKELSEFQQVAFFANFPAGKLVFADGDRVDTFALILSGSVRVYKTGIRGREITLYRFGSGGSCILNANAILNNQLFPAHAVSERAVEAVMIAEDVFRSWVQRSALWREFVFGLLALHLGSVLCLVEDIVFRRMDARVAAFLRQRSGMQNPIWVTHQEIAAELGSSREVISRILESFSAIGVVRSGRGVVEVVDFEVLQMLSGV